MIVIHLQREIGRKRVWPLSQAVGWNVSWLADFNFGEDVVGVAGNLRTWGRQKKNVPGRAFHGLLVETHGSGRMGSPHQIRPDSTRPVRFDYLLTRPDP